MTDVDVPTLDSRDVMIGGDRHAALVDQIRLFATTRAGDRIPRLLDLMLDGVGVAVAGRTAHAGRIAASVFGAAATPWDAAWLHGMQMHALDFDDTHEPSLCHTATALLPGLLALGRAHRSSGRDLLDAYDLGIRFIDFASACGPALNTAGAHSTAILGSLGSGAACGWLLTHDAEMTADAVEVAALLAAGLGAAFGSDGKPLQAARASEIGVRAATFVAAGLNAPHGAAFGDHGVLALWLGVDAPTTVRWGDECAGAAGLVAIKPYPSCFLTHSTIDATLSLHGSLDLLGAADVARMSVEVHPLAAQIADKTSLGAENAKFSLRYCALAALTDGRVNVDTFSVATEQRLVDDAGSFETWVSKVHVRTDPAAPPLAARISLLLADGREGAITVEAPRGSRSAPLTRDDVIAKFRDNVSGEHDGNSVQRLLDEVMGMPTAPDITALELLTSACTAAAPSTHRGLNGNS
ncbi:MAG: MmgE/PrpD family protein [Candidatus Dormiibacterota bacterium]